MRGLSLIQFELNKDGNFPALNFKIIVETQTIGLTLDTPRVTLDNEKPPPVMNFFDGR